LADAIGKKDSADMAREMLSVFAKPTIWGMIWTTAWPFPNETWEWKIGNFLVGAVAGKMLFSTSTKTYVANALRKFSWLEKKELTRFIQTKWAEKISKPVLEKLIKIQEWLKALPSPKTVSPSKMWTPQQPIVLWMPKKKDIIEIPLSRKK
jgi:hypothetical protein